MSSDKEQNRFDPQHSTSYEIGAKFVGDSYIFNAAIFRMDIKDIHVYRHIGTQSFADNAKKAHSQGVEMDGVYFVNDNFSVEGSIGLIDAKYDDYDAGSVKYDKERIENTPKYSADLAFSYKHDNGAYALLDFNARGEITYFDGANKKMIKDESALKSNLKLGYKMRSLDLYAYCKNITDESYVANYMSKPGTTPATLNDPRTFGAGVNYKF